MEIFRHKSWKSFKRRVDALFDDARRLRVDTGRAVSNPVFRGQANSEWPLSTTLEREFGPDDLIEFYLDIFYPSLTQLQRKLDFELPALSTINFKALNFRDLCNNLPWSDKLALLRHHSSPSPLLDWTYSPYVAAFFAFTARPASADSKMRTLKPARPGRVIARFAFREVM